MSASDRKEGIDPDLFTTVCHERDEAQAALLVAEREREKLRAALIETLGGGKGETLRWSQGREWFYASDVAQALGIIPSHASNHLRALVDLGVITAERHDPPGGGKRFRYRASVSLEGEAPLRCTADCDRTFHESCDAHGIKAAPELWGLPVSPEGEA